jgi:hypothetical protein
MARRRVIVSAVLVVGEGKSELVLLRHIKAHFVQRGGGMTVKVLGGYGKGGKGVIDYAVSRSRGADYDRRVALLDTDADWNDVQRARARAEGILVVESVPCLEAWLLSIHRIQGERSSAAHKAEFEQQFGGPAHDPRVMDRHFGRDILEDARGRVGTLHRLLELLGI